MIKMDFLHLDFEKILKTLTKLNKIIQQRKLSGIDLNVEQVVETGSEKNRSEVLSFTTSWRFFNTKKFVYGFKKYETKYTWGYGILIEVGMWWRWLRFRYKIFWCWTQFFLVSIWNLWKEKIDKILKSVLAEGVKIDITTKDIETKSVMIKDDNKKGLVKVIERSFLLQFFFSFRERNMVTEYV